MEGQETGGCGVVSEEEDLDADFRGEEGEMVEGLRV